MEGVLENGRPIEGKYGTGWVVLISVARDFCERLSPVTVQSIFPNPSNYFCTMTTTQGPKVDTLVLDAGPLIERKPLRGLANRYVTTPQVVNELKDPRVRQYFEQLSLLEGVNVEVKMPSPVSVSKGRLPHSIRYLGI